MEAQQPTARIVGAGIAGIASAIRWARKGYAVHVHEANSYPGGKLSQFQLGDYRFDAGPSLFTLPFLVDELFTLCGEDPRDHFNYLKKTEECRYFWDDGTRLTAHSDPAEFASEAERVLGEPAAHVRAHLDLARRQYEATKGLFLERSLHKASTYLRRDALPALAALPSLKLTQTMHAVHAQRFRSPKMVQLFDRFATYNGSTPYQAPGTLAMIPHLEFGFGTFVPFGGMVAITESLVALAERQGVQFHYGQRVERILVANRRATGLLVGGTELPADVVVSNMDVTPTYRRLLPDLKAPEKTLSQERSSSALIFYWGVRREFPELDLHNILFANDYEAEFRDLFERKTLHDDPTVYIHITSKDLEGEAPVGGENWFVMINAPADYGQDWASWRATARASVLAKIERALGIDVAPFIEVEEVLDPPTIQSRTGSDRGALYGASSNNAMAAFLRHPNFHRQIPNLFFVGGSAHPGGGIPLCLLSAKIAADLG
ncbi:MAG: phytoene dehydrogenase [Cryomorphaceae bacterium BACL18 MAG-120924-bin36]|nr:MAG: phytoene dehydrogenase [Cryomorphaceae bacterium BACL18 MAG-120924-bin36]